MTTFINQSTENMVLTLPFDIAQEVIERMKTNKKAIIHLITNKINDGILNTIIKNILNN
jgi:hypothetical protein